MSEAQPSLDWINDAPQMREWFARFLAKNWVSLLRLPEMRGKQFATACDGMEVALPRLLKSLSLLPTWQAQLQRFNDEAPKHGLPEVEPPVAAQQVRLFLKRISRREGWLKTDLENLDAAALQASPWRNTEAKNQLIEEQLGTRLLRKHYPTDGELREHGKNKREIAAYRKDYPYDSNLRDDLQEISVQFQATGFGEDTPQCALLAPAIGSLHQVVEAFARLESVSLAPPHHPKAVETDPRWRPICEALLPVWGEVEPGLRRLLDALKRHLAQPSICTPELSPKSASTSSELASAVREVGAVELTRFIMRALGAWPMVRTGMPFDPDACLEAIERKLGRNAAPRQTPRGLILETIVRCEELRTPLLRLAHAEPNQRMRRMRAALADALKEISRPATDQACVDAAVVLGDSKFRTMRPKDVVAKINERLGLKSAKTLGDPGKGSLDTAVRKAKARYGLT